MCVYQHQDHLFALLMVVPGKRPHSSRILEAASQHIVQYTIQQKQQEKQQQPLASSTIQLPQQYRVPLLLLLVVVVSQPPSTMRLYSRAPQQYSSTIVFATVYCWGVEDSSRVVQSSRRFAPQWMVLTPTTIHTHTAITFQFSTTLTCAHRNVDRRGASSSSSLYRGCYVEADAKNEETTRPSLLHTIHSLRLLLTHCFFFLVYLCLFEVPPFHSRTSVYSVTTTTTTS